MPINEWSESILIAELADEPALSDELDNLIARLENVGEGQHLDVIIDMKSVTYINSSNIAQLLRIRKMMRDVNGRLLLCAVSDRVWSVFIVTGLDQVFQFTEDVTTSLATLQLGE